MPRRKPVTVAIDKALAAQAKARHKDDQPAPDSGQEPAIDSRLETSTNEVGGIEVGLIELREDEVRDWARDRQLVNWNKNPLPLEVIEQYREAHPQPLGLPGDEVGKVHTPARCPRHRQPLVDGVCPSCALVEAEVQSHRAATQRARADMNRGMAHFERAQARDLREQRLRGLAMARAAEAELSRMGQPIEGPMNGSEDWYALHPHAPRPVRG